MKVKTRYIPGTYNAISDISGFKFKAKDMVMISTGDGDLFVHKSEVEKRNPQLEPYVIRPETFYPKHPRPPGTPVHL